MAASTLLINVEALHDSLFAFHMASFKGLLAWNHPSSMGEFNCFVMAEKHSKTEIFSGFHVWLVYLFSFYAEPLGVLRASLLSAYGVSEETGLLPAVWSVIPLTEP